MPRARKKKQEQKKICWWSAWFCMLLLTVPNSLTYSASLPDTVDVRFVPTSISPRMILLWSSRILLLLYPLFWATIVSCLLDNSHHFMLTNIKKNPPVFKNPFLGCIPFSCSLSWHNPPESSGLHVFFPEPIPVGTLPPPLHWNSSSKSPKSDGTLSSSYPTHQQHFT